MNEIFNRDVEFRFLKGLDGMVRNGMTMRSVLDSYNDFFCSYTNIIGNRIANGGGIAPVVSI